MLLQTSRFTEYINEYMYNDKLLEIMKYRVDEYVNLVRSGSSSEQEWTNFLSSLEEQLTLAFDSIYGNNSRLKQMYEFRGKEYPYEDVHPFLFIADESNNQQEEVTEYFQKVQADFSYDIYEEYSLADERHVYDSSTKETCRLRVVHTYEGSIYYNNGEVTMLTPVHVATRNYYIYD